MTGKKLWITYAWSDNKDQQVDFIIQELKKEGLDVQYDRIHIVPGQRLWPQIDEGIAKADAWALVVSKASLRSEPCREELAYALDKAISSREKDFPVMGIFVERIDRSLIPSALKTRLYTNIQDPNWIEQVKAGVECRLPTVTIETIDPVVIALHPQGDKLTLEAHPRSGRWIPCIAYVPMAERELMELFWIGPQNYPRHGGGEVNTIQDRDRDYYFKALHGQATPFESVYLTLNGAPAELFIGQAGSPFEVQREQLDQVRAHFAKHKK